jgi:hypothetical protein
VKLPTRKFLLRFVIFSLSATAVLGIISVLWSGLGETGMKILGSAILADAASFLALCCSGRVTSAWQRAIQVTGIVGACLGLVTGLCSIWWGITAGGPGEGIGRAAAVLFILAAASAHASLLLPLRSHSRLARTVVTGTIICTAAAAELIANYALIPDFDPGNGYDKALAVILILDVLGTILILFLHRFGPPRPATHRPAQLTPSCRPFLRPPRHVPPPGSGRSCAPGADGRPAPGLAVPVMWPSCRAASP